jgi:hypothetical protein
VSDWVLAIGVFITIVLITVGLAVMVGTLFARRSYSLYCPACGNAVTNEWQEIVFESGSKYLWTWRACPIYRDQRTDHDIPWPRHYHTILKSELQPPAFDPMTGEENKP